MSKDIDIRGVIEFQIGDLNLQLTPSFKNLATMERVLERGSLAIYNDFLRGNVRIGEVAAIVALLAKPVDKGVKLPKTWNVETVGDLIMEEGFDTFIGVVARWLNATMSAKPKTAPVVQDEPPVEGGETGE